MNGKSKAFDIFMSNFVRVRVEDGDKWETVKNPSDIWLEALKNLGVYKRT